MEWTGSSSVFVIRTLNDSCGTAAFGVASTSSTWKCRSGKRASRNLVKLPKEIVDLFPDLCATAQPMPMGAEDAHQPEALIDGRAVIARLVTNAIHQQRFDVGFKLRQHRIARYHGVPVLEVERRLHRSSGAGILRNHPPGCAAVDEICHVDGDQQALPFLIVHGEVVEPGCVPRDTLVALACVAIEE